MTAPDLPSLESLPLREGVCVLVRSSLNVPIAPDGTPQSTLRLRRALPTIRALRARGCRVVVMGHRGRLGTESLAPLVHWFERHLVEPVAFASAPGEVPLLLQRVPLVLLENLRKWEGERNNSPAFARTLARLGDVFVNDAFAASHRSHASIVGVPTLLPHAAGVSFVAEVRALWPAVSPPADALLIVGGAKFATKEPLIRAALSRYAHVFVGGALAHDIWRAWGWEIGTSLTSTTSLPGDILSHPRLLVPLDVEVKGRGGAHRMCDPRDVHPDERIVDAGPRTVALIASLAKKSSLVVWNGPLGAYEEGYSRATRALAHALAPTATSIIVGGGDTVAVIEQEGMTESFSFVSTGGGAMLTFLTEGTLPGIEALMRAPRGEG